MKLLQKTKEVEIQGVKFIIGVIRAFEWNDIVTRSESAFPALNKFIRKTPKEELDKMSPVEISNRICEEMDPEEVAANNKQVFKAHWDMIRFAVKGHWGFLDEDGAEIPFKLTVDGTVDPELIDAYHATGLFHQLALEVKAFNTLREVYKKNS